MPRARSRDAERFAASSRTRPAALWRRRGVGDRTRTPASSRAADRMSQGCSQSLNLPPGRYTLTFQKDGFTPFVQQDVAVGVESALRLDVTLQVGESEGLSRHRRRRMLDSRSPPPAPRCRTPLSRTFRSTSPAADRSRTSPTRSRPASKATTGHRTSSAARRSAKRSFSTARRRRSRSRGTSPSRRRRWTPWRSSRFDTSGMSGRVRHERAAASSISHCARAPTRSRQPYGQLRNEALNANTLVERSSSPRSNPSQGDAYAKPRDRQHVFGGSRPADRSRRTARSTSPRSRNTGRRGRQLGHSIARCRRPHFSTATSARCSIRLPSSARDAAGNRSTGARFSIRATRLVFPGNVIPRDRISRVSRGSRTIYGHVVSAAGPASDQQFRRAGLRRSGIHAASVQPEGRSQPHRQRPAVRVPYLDQPAAHARRSRRRVGSD